MLVGVVIVAGGRGARMGAGMPKQLLDLDGRSILQRSVAAFDAHPHIAEIVVVLPSELVTDGPALAGQTACALRVVAGGERRQDSVRRGIAGLSASVDVVLIHDAARPMVDRALIDRVIDAAAESGAAIPAVPSRDTVKRVDRARRVITETIPRDEIWLAQTPQGFERELLTTLMASTETNVDGAPDVTDEAMLAERAGLAVRVVVGDERNIKITTMDDLTTARATLAAIPRIGTGYDLHRLVEGRPLVLAGIVIAADRGPLGHSDGDVVSHALVDAMFGAAGTGDIGRHFPDSDPRWKDAAGLDLLERATAIVRDAGWFVTNADVTVVLERPKLAGHVAQIRAALGNVLGVSADQVSVKGKTNEGVDAVGRGEAIAAHAVVMLSARKPG